MQRYQFRRQNLAFTPEIIKNLIVINLTIFIILLFSGQGPWIIAMNYFSLNPNFFNQFYIWQLVSYMFLHGGIFHIFFNMFALWMFGRELEIIWGSKRFLKYYMVCGIGSGLATAIISPGVTVIGASGAVYGVMLAYGLLFPNRMVYLYGLFPLKTKFLVFGLFIISLYYSMGNNYDGISHITHLFGIVVGFIYLKKKFINNFTKKIKLWYIQKQIEKIEYDNIYHNEDNDKIKNEMNHILEKLNTHGWSALSDSEKITIKEGTEQLKKKEFPN
tara:strand:- start:51 stop:872 length:822 start_codon:yes stop_codon:yes gene_type:complete